LKGYGHMQSNNRILKLFLQMVQGDHIKLHDAKKENDVSERTIQRDMTTIHRNIKDIPYYTFHHNTDNTTDEYYLEQKDLLPFDEITAIMKILIGTRAFSKVELKKISSSLTSAVSVEHKKLMADMLTTLKSGGYLPVNKSNDLLKRIKDFNKFANKRQTITFTYHDSNPAGPSTKTKTGVPLSLYFAGNYFYVIMYRQDPDHPDEARTYVYRLDRFQMYRIKRKALKVPHDKSEDEESIRNKSFMLNSGAVISYEFNYRGYFRTALDQLPNSSLKRTKTGAIYKGPDGSVTIYGSMFFNGAKMWALGQGKLVTVKAPQSLITAVKEDLKATLDGYKKR